MLLIQYCLVYFFFFFFNDTATTEIYTLSLHDALPIWLDPHCQHAPSRARSLWPLPQRCARRSVEPPRREGAVPLPGLAGYLDRKSTRLNSSHANISYAVFCLKKKKKLSKPQTQLSDNT